MNNKEKFKKALEKPWAANTFALCSAVVLFVFLSHINLLGIGIARLYRYVQPVVIGLIIAYVTDPLVAFFETRVLRRLKKPSLRRGLSVFLTFVILIACVTLILIALIPQLISSIKMFVSNLESYNKAFDGLMKDLDKWAMSHNFDISKYTSLGSNLVSVVTSRLPKSVDGILNTTITYGKNVFNGVIAFIIAVYFLMDKRRLLRGAHRLWRAIVSDNGYRRSNNFLGRCNEIMIRYILCDLLDGLIIGVTNAVFMLIIGYPYVPLISVVVGVTNLAPTFGPILGAVIGAGILVLINPWYALGFLIFTIALQTADGYVIKPKLFGNTLGVPSIGILIAIIVFGRMFGAVGVLLAIPFAAIIDYIYKDGILPALEVRRKRRVDKARNKAGGKAKPADGKPSERPAASEKSSAKQAGENSCAKPGSRQS